MPTMEQLDSLYIQLQDALLEMIDHEKDLNIHGESFAVLQHLQESFRFLEISEMYCERAFRLME